MTQYGFYFDSARCTGCRTCEMACKDYKDLPRPSRFAACTTMRAAHGRRRGRHVHVRHVRLPRVARLQPLRHAAVHGELPLRRHREDADTGLVHIIDEKCTGAGMCVETCPYNVPVLNEETKLGMKCDGCADRVAAGLSPICVEACPLRALEFGDIEELRAAHADTVDGIAPMPTGDETTPSIAINACPAAKEPGDTTGAIANEKEVTLVAAGA